MEKVKIIVCLHLFSIMKKVLILKLRMQFEIKLKIKRI